MFDSASSRATSSVVEFMAAIREQFFSPGQRLVGVATTVLCAYLLALLLAPLMITLFYAVHGRDFMGDITNEWSLDAFNQLGAPVVLRVVIRSALLALANTVLCTVAGVVLASFISKRSERTKRLWVLAMIFPISLNTVLVAYSWQTLLGNAGVINRLLLFAGLISEPVTILYTPLSVMLGMFAAYVPFFFVPFMVSLGRLDPGYVRAAHALGSGKWTTFWNVIVPLTRPGLVTGGAMVFLPSFAEFVIPDLLGGGKVFLLGNLIQLCFYDGRNWPLGAALCVFALLMLLAVLVPFGRFLRGVFAT